MSKVIHHTTLLKVFFFSLFISYAWVIQSRIAEGFSGLKLIFYALPELLLGYLFIAFITCQCKNVYLKNGLLFIFLLVFSCVYFIQVMAIFQSNQFVSVLAFENIDQLYLVVTPREIRFLSVYLGAFSLFILIYFLVYRKFHQEKSMYGKAMVVLVFCVGIQNVSSVNDFFNHNYVEGTPILSFFKNGYLSIAGGVEPVSDNVAFGSNFYFNIDSEYPFLKETVYAKPLEVGSSIERPNVIVIFAEGMSSRLLGCYRSEPVEGGLTQNIDQLSLYSMRVDNYYNHTSATFRGIQGQLVSGFPFHGGGADGWLSEKYANEYKQKSYFGLPDILAKHGYNTIFLSPHVQKDALTSLLEMLHFKQIYTAEKINAEFLKSQAVFHQGAINDEGIYTALRRYLEMKVENETPFFIGMYSLGTHAFMDSDGKKYGDGKNPTLNTVHNMDDSFGRFWEYFIQSPYAKNTILIFTTDHAHYQEKSFIDIAGKDYQPYFVDKVPLIIYNPVRTLPKVLNAHERTSLDLAPTILHMLDISVKNSFLGTSLFENIPEHFHSLHSEGNSFYAIYNGKIYPYNKIPVELRDFYSQYVQYVKTYNLYEEKNKIFPENKNNQE